MRGEKYRSSRPLLVRAAAALAGLAALAAGLASCGGGRASDVRVHGDTMTVFTSLPRQGVGAREADAVAAGERLALADAHGRVGKRRIRLVELDDSDPTGQIWDPSTVEANARRATADPTTIAYIGELSLGGSAVSVPVTNDAGIVQVSPADGLTGLTQVDPGGSESSPERYYPRDRRSFLRLVPTDLAQAATLVSWAADDGASSLAIVHDGSLFGRELAGDAAAAAAQAHITVTDVIQAGPDPTAYPGLATSLAQKNPDAVLYTGFADASAGPLLAATGQALPHAHLFASSAVAGAAPMPPDLPSGVGMLKPGSPPSRYPAAGRRVLAELGAQLGTPVDPDAVFGYEAMRVVLDAIARAGRKGNDRQAVAKSALEPRLRHGAAGDYSITASGDISPQEFASYVVSGNALSFEGMRGPGSALPPNP